jgi:hypothetical protein
VGQVATLAGVGVDTVRGWDRQGLLCARRLPSGQRRYRFEEVEEFLRQRSPSARLPDRRADRDPLPRSESRPPTDFPVQPEAPTSNAGAAAPSPGRRVLEARADLEVLKARHAAEVIERASVKRRRPRRAHRSWPGSITRPIVVLSPSRPTVAHSADRRLPIGRPWSCGTSRDS